MQFTRIDWQREIRTFVSHSNSSLPYVGQSTCPTRRFWHRSISPMRLNAFGDLQSGESMDALNGSAQLTEDPPFLVTMAETGAIILNA